MRKRKRVFAFYRYTECDSMAAYLEGMARKGWHFSGWRLGMIFEKGEPENTEYAVEVFQKAVRMTEDLKRMRRNMVSIVRRRDGSWLTAGRSSASSGRSGKMPFRS